VPDRDWLVGIDVGGTFTDGVLLRPGHDPQPAKSATDVENPIAGLRACLDLLAAAAGSTRSQLLSRTAKLAYGTTLAANLAVEGKGARTGFITTRGFRDTLTMAGIGRERIGIDLAARRPPSLVPRRLIREVRERVDAEGRELAPLNAEDVRGAIALLQEEGVEAVGVCLLWSFRNPVHEQEIGEMVRAQDGWYVSLSCEVAPLLGEYERSATTALNAILGPPVRRHLEAVEGELAADGLRTPPLVMQSTGGLQRAADAVRRPVSLLASGPAGGVLAAKLLADTMDLPKVLCVDMGGTTFDVSLITDGEPATRDRTVHAGQEMFLPAIDVRSIGAGGGSLAWIDAGVRLKVGPRSAGSRPGPACYGRGGLEATVTDANCELGRLNPEGLAAGRLQLDRTAARTALARVGRPLGMSPAEAAEGIIAIVDAAMAGAMRAQTVQRGLDPADYTLVAYGGAGPLHVAALAEELGIRRVVVPWLAPVLSAYGVAASNILHVLSLTEARPIEETEPILATLARLEKDAAGMLAADGVPAGSRIYARWAQARFTGQLHAVDVPVADGPLDPSLLKRLAGDFVARYERLYGPGTASAEAGIELISLRVEGTGVTQDQPFAPPAAVGSEREGGQRTVRWSGREWPARRLHGPLGSGTSLEGPALVDHPGHTVWIPPGVRAHVDALGSMVLEMP
jgi:N-methylhydantoinase A